jgi:hypothetical protein
LVAADRQRQHPVRQGCSERRGETEGPGIFLRRERIGHGESSGALVRSGNRFAGRGFVWFDAIFTAEISSIKHYFALSGTCLYGMDFIVPSFAY